MTANRYYSVPTIIVKHHSDDPSDYGLNSINMTVGGQESSNGQEFQAPKLSLLTSLALWRLLENSFDIYKRSESQQQMPGHL